MRNSESMFAKLRVVKVWNSLRCRKKSRRSSSVTSTRLRTGEPDSGYQHCPQQRGGIFADLTVGEVDQENLALVHHPP